MTPLCITIRLRGEFVLTELEKKIKAARVFVLDVQAPAGAACDSELHVFSSQEACQKVFIEIYGERVLGRPCLASIWDEGDDAFEDEDDREMLEATNKRDEQMINEALLAYDKANENIGGHTAKGYTFRVLKRRTVTDADELL